MGTAKVAIELAAELNRPQVERMANSVLTLSPDYAELSRAQRQCRQGQGAEIGVAQSRALVIPAKAGIHSVAQLAALSHLCDIRKQ